jgi:phosphoesterase RecJ-like protein
MHENGAGAATREQVLEELRSADKLIVVTHENVDGDALGSLIAMQEILVAQGRDSLMFIDASEFPLPNEYEFFTLSGLVSAPPEDLEQRTIVFLDCGNLERNPAVAFRRPGAHIVNSDHHHDNTRFGTVNYVLPEASCTAEIVWDLMHGLGVEPTLHIAEALYVGLITDTGRFMYENTGPRAHEMAADLIEAGVDVHEIYRRVYKGVPFGQL